MGKKTHRPRLGPTGGNGQAHLKTPRDQWMFLEGRTRFRFLAERHFRCGLAEGLGAEFGGVFHPLSGEGEDRPPGYPAR